MTYKCPKCKWFLRNISRDIDLFECSKISCNVICQIPNDALATPNPQNKLLDNPTLLDTIFLPGREARSAGTFDVEGQQHPANLARPNGE